VALFGRKKPDEPEPSAEAEEVVFKPQPGRATKWVAHAQSMAGASNTETALVYYASGVKFDPANESILSEMLDVAKQHLRGGGKRISNKNAKPIGGSEPIDKMAMAILMWMTELTSGPLAIKAFEAIVAAGQPETGRFFAPHVLGIASRGKKPTKQQYVTIKDLCKRVESWDHALTAGQLAMGLDPTDGQLEHEIKDLSAQRAMSEGGYEAAAGKEGGFRDFVKDMDKQREMEQEESIAGAGGGSDRVLARAKAAFQEAPEVPENVHKYATLLRREGSAAALKEAEDVLLRGFKSTGEYRFRMAAGDIRIQRFRDRISEVEKQLADTDTPDPAMESRRTSLEEEHLAFESKEYHERAERYPTDRVIRYHLGEVAFRQGDIETAMGCFQKSKDEPRLRVRAGHMLGRCFAAESWHAEAIGEFKDVLAKIDATESDRELEIRYDLMTSLIDLAEAEQSEEHAREALDICSGIARQDITYRDIRERRRAIDALVRSLG
jgi:tetratricopeptide (TPR) repeat protein